ncbi:MAG: alpha/beta hydrolase [Saprospiraceae bacterium]
MNNIEVKSEGEFKYIESNPDAPVTLILLHGLMGALSNFEGIISNFGKKFNVAVPILPLFDISLRHISVSRLVTYVSEFVEYKGYQDFYILGNSLGGHIAQMYTMENPHKVKGLILTGSSGLFESAMGNTFPKRGNKEYIRKKTESVFYDPKVATEELVDEVFSTVTDLRKAMNVVALAKSAVRHNLEDKLYQITIPTLLIWGIQDEVTPLWVGEKFHEMLINSELVKVDKCGHAPMMEKPEVFNQALECFIGRVESGKFYSEKKEARVVE